MPPSIAIEIPKVIAVATISVAVLLALTACNNETTTEYGSVGGERHTDLKAKLAGPWEPDFDATIRSELNDDLAERKLGEEFVPIAHWYGGNRKEYYFFVADTDLLRIGKFDKSIETFFYQPKGDEKTFSLWLQPINRTGEDIGEPFGQHWLILDDDTLARKVELNHEPYESPSTVEDRPRNKGRRFSSLKFKSFYLIYRRHEGSSAGTTSAASAGRDGESKAFRAESSDPPQNQAPWRPVTVKTTSGEVFPLKVTSRPHDFHTSVTTGHDLAYRLQRMNYPPPNMETTGKVTVKFWKRNTEHGLIWIGGGQYPGFTLVAEAYTPNLTSGRKLAALAGEALSDLNCLLAGDTYAVKRLHEELQQSLVVEDILTRGGYTITTYTYEGDKVDPEKETAWVLNIQCYPERQ